MTTHERFQKAFSSLHTSDHFKLDLEEQTMKKNIKLRKSIAAACTAVALGAGGVTCYAADVGNIQRTIQVWLHGDQTTATMTVSDDGITHFEMSDESGNTIYGGGVAFNDDGTERPLTASEIEEDSADPDVEKGDDGRIYLYYKGQKMDITDKFADDGLCYVKLQDGDKTIYVTATKNGGVESREDRYAEKSELPKEWFEDE